MVRRQVMSGLAVVILAMVAFCPLGGVSFRASAALPMEWQAETSMLENRTQAVVVSDDNGVIYVMGGARDMVGINYGPPVPDVASYDPATDEWTDLSPMDVGVRGAAGAVGSDGRVYVFGGANDSMYAQDLTQIYDPSTDTWSTGTDVPLGVWEAKAAPGYFDDEILVVGGEGAPAAVQIYNIVDDSWSSGAVIPVGVLGGAFLRMGYYFYYLGGSDPGYTPTDVMLRYDGWSDSWSVYGSIPEPISSLAAVMGPDNLLYIMGGGDSAVNVGVGYNKTYFYNQDADEWTRIADLPAGARYLGAAASDNGKVYVIGGNNGTEVFTQLLSLQVMDVSSSLSRTVVGVGEGVTVTIGIELANAGEVEASEYYAHMVNPDGVPMNPVYGWFEGLYSEFAFEMYVPMDAEPGSYSVVVMMYVYTELVSLELTDAELHFTVVVPETTEEISSQLENMSGQIDSLEEALAALLEEIEAMQDEMDDLKDAMNDTQQSADDVEAAVDGKMDSTLGIAMMILLVLLLVLVIVSMVMARRSQIPPPP